ncbi:hypothetical protein KIN20_019439 [Parelaphostrongylus tenuis]|uniref:Uncharacterized protein n=1 Tax=Parelaphostrongylus tenuis TaxID=148309 RepID=A0AAD5QSF2_PARTN|nr:hypothetical protein KIN20_019439 [Parelaphostrongylus tenuis]
MENAHVFQKSPLFDSKDGGSETYRAVEELISLVKTIPIGSSDDQGCLTFTVEMGRMKSS